MDISDEINEEALKILREKCCLCFSGGGVLGIGHCGALVRLFELGGLKHITHSTGSSVGSIVATAIACGADSKYIEDSLMELDESRFKDGGNWLAKIVRFIIKYGIHKGDEITVFAEELLEELTGNKNITFQEAYDKYNIHLTITYLSLRYKKTIYADHINTPSLCIKTAIKRSSTIPAYFKLDKKIANHRVEDLLGDGAVINNFPINISRDQGGSPRHILGFKFYSPEDLKYTYPNNNQNRDYGIPGNVKEVYLRLLDILRQQALRYHVHDEDWKLTCKINIGKYNTTDFDISEEGKMWLYESGKQSMDNYLDEIKKLLLENKYP